MGKTLEEHLKHAAALFDVGKIVMAGQLWQAILKIDPANSEAKAGLRKVRDSLAAGADAESAVSGTDSDAPAASLQAQPLSEESQDERDELPQPDDAQDDSSASASAEFERYLLKGRSLYDEGDLQGALEAWEKAFAIDPGQSLVQSYARGVRRELGLPMPDDLRHPAQEGNDSPLAEKPLDDNSDQLDSKASGCSGHPPSNISYAESGFVNIEIERRAPALPKKTGGDEEIRLLIDRGSNLYEMGQLENAVVAWSEALALDPDNSLIKSYLSLAQSDLDNEKAIIPSDCGPSLTQAPPEDDGPTALPSISSSGATETNRIRNGNASSATAPFRNQSSRTATAEDDSGESASKNRFGKTTGDPIAPHDKRSASASAKNPITQMPDVVTHSPALNRHGPSLHDDIHISPLLPRPRVLAISLVAALLLVVGAFWIKATQKDALLKAAQTAIREAAIKQAAQYEKVEPLALTTAELGAQARAAMADSPIKAFMLAQEAIKRDPMDTSAPKLLEDAKRAMAALPLPQDAKGGSLNQLMAAGNLDSAEKLLEARLMQNPGDMRTRENLARITLLAARAYARLGRWDSARSQLSMGAALFPNDLAWRARLKLLDYLQSAPEDEQRRWIELLG